MKKENQDKDLALPLSVGEYVGNMNLIFQHVKIERLGQQQEIRSEQLNI